MKISKKAEKLLLGEWLYIKKHYYFGLSLYTVSLLNGCPSCGEKHYFKLLTTTRKEKYVKCSKTKEKILIKKGLFPPELEPKNMKITDKEFDVFINKF